MAVGGVERSQMWNDEKYPYALIMFFELESNVRMATTLVNEYDGDEHQCNTHEGP